jgi:predicted glycogen debranching enzyme
MINFDKTICGDFLESTSREWLETNGIGGFASGTISGANTRRYHGLLTPATRPPLGRITMLSKFEETLIVEGNRYELSTNQFPKTVVPQGFRFIKFFTLNPFPTWVYEINGIEIEKKVFMIHGSNSTVLQYRALNLEKKIELELKPLLSFSDYHSLQRETSDFNRDFNISENLISMQPIHDMPPFYLSHNANGIEKSGYWYRNFEYSIEKERGFDFTEDLFQPFVLKFNLASTAIVIASTEPIDISKTKSFENDEHTRRQLLIMKAEAKDEFAQQLVLAADQFVVSRGDGKTIIAGYPWFSDWGRDTMISLSGLTLATNRPEIAKSILLEFSKHVSEGMLPNRFPDAGEVPEYNTVDATLWYFEAVRAYVEKTKDYDFVCKYLYEKLANILAWHVEGTRYSIKMDDDGLLFAGENGVQLTWMDAKIGDLVITPRTGKAVEIQALWYNALRIMEKFANEFGDSEDCEQYKRLASIAKKNFNKQFWNETEECLHDVINGENKDASVRPNQIFAVSLHYSMLSIGKARKVVKKVETELLTPLGLRSLSPKDEKYCPIYEGSPLKRDSAYHQGTVWAWLIGGFIDAYRKVSPNGNKSEAQIQSWLTGFENHLSEAGLGQISEIFDADSPNLPRGCFAQAWSVAELLRVSRPKSTNSQESKETK